MSFKSLGACLIMMALLAGCNDSQSEQGTPNGSDQTSVTIKHQLGEATVSAIPKRVVALDMNDVDFLDLLGVNFVAMPHDFIPSYLKRYAKDKDIADTGAIVQPNLEKVYKAKPDLILSSPLHDANYTKLEEVAPVVRYDIDYKNSHNYLSNLKKHLSDLGRLFNQETKAQEITADLDKRVNETKSITEKSPKKALVLLHNNGSFSNFGVESRYGFIFHDLGVKPAANISKGSLHGYPISSELINQADPDIIYIIDRTAVMENKKNVDKSSIKNPLLEQTKAWKNDEVIFVDGDAWYTTAASPNALKIIIDDVLKGYQ
ncbi:siderophore ABC transporter substrate-binding protein [Brackiella oedipodis]|uniref:siderophore ABC transporter substrate-binding protein n=1 Tax=Brackiella oedipodis TaxID=124225 RepID=UPI00048D4B70|nr:siderophore ABC transporter substrate-binding protein [Brackiella oedipodis]